MHPKKIVRMAKKRRQGSDQEHNGDLTSQSTPQLNGSTRRIASCTRQRANEEALQARVAALRFQVCDLRSLKIAWHSQYLFTHTSDTGSLAQLVRHYYALFRYGMQTVEPRTSPAARLHVRHQENFMRQVMDPQAHTGRTQGPVSSMNQWRLYHAAHASFVGEIGALAVVGPNETPTIILKSKYRVRISQATFAIMFPSAMTNRSLMQRLLHKKVVYNCVSRVRFTHEGRSRYKVVDVGMVEGFVAAGCSLKDIAELLRSSALSVECTIQEHTARRQVNAEHRNRRPPVS